MEQIPGALLIFGPLACLITAIVMSIVTGTIFFTLSGQTE